MYYIKHICSNVSVKKSKNSTTVQNTTRHLKFNSQETNPLSFLKEFEKCTDLKTDRDKLWKIRDFVDKEHQGMANFKYFIHSDKEMLNLAPRQTSSFVSILLILHSLSTSDISSFLAEFSQLRITGDWSTAQRVFVEKYLTSFIEKKKREINTDFYQANSLRQFVDQKFSSLETYTSLTFTHQLEVVMNSLPVEVSYLLMVNEVFFRTKYEILDFCDSIQEVCEIYKKDKASDQMDLDDPDVVFNLRGEYDFLETMSETSQSTWSSRNSSQPLWSTQQ